MPARWMKSSRLRIGAALTALLASAVAVPIIPQRIAAGYLFAYLAALHIVLGAMAVLLIHSLSGGAWEKWLAAPSRAAVATLPGFALLAIPLWLCLDTLFPWAGASRAAVEFTAHQDLWLQPSWQIVRHIFYLLAWLGIAAGMAVWSRNKPLHMPTDAAAVSLIVFVLFTSLFAVDWIMSITPGSTTSMIGFLMLSEQLVAAIALAALWLGFTGSDKSQQETEKQARNDIGNLLLAAVMFHAYCLYMDYLIVWEANLPSEIGWYLARTGVFHGTVIVLVAVSYIALPVLLLLFRRVKSSPRGLGSVGALILLGHLLLIFWYLSPIFNTGDVWVGWGNLLVAAGFLLACSFMFYSLAGYFQHMQERYMQEKKE